MQGVMHKKSKDAVDDSVKKYVRKALTRATETKMITYNSYATGATDVSWAFTWPSIGSSSITRIGDKIKVKGFQLNYHYQNTSVPAIMRMVVVVSGDTTPIPSTTLFKDAPSAYLTGHVDTNAYKVLYDKTMVVSPNGPTMVKDRCYIPFSRVIRFDEGTTTTSNGYIHAWFGQANGAGTPITAGYLVGGFATSYTDS